eukprot:374254_1
MSSESLQTEEIKADKNVDVIHKMYRSPEAIGYYLDNFCPKISLSTAFSCCVLSPFSICLNIYFICDHFIEWNIFHNNASATQSLLLHYGKASIIWFEFVGIMFLIATTSIILCC